MKYSRNSQIIRCFSLAESQENVIASNPDISEEDFQNIQVYSSKDADGDLAFAVTDKIVDSVIQDKKYIYSVFDTIFNEETNEILFVFFPSIEEYINELTEIISDISHVKSLQWSRIKQEHVLLDDYEDKEYFVVLKIKLNLISSMELKPVKKLVKKIIPPVLKSKDLLNPKDSKEITRTDFLTRAVFNAKKLIELQ